MKIDYKTAPSLIEHILPVARLSGESHKERKSGSGQRLTGIGKWWGRKPLVLVRACVLGALLPATQNPQKDLEIFERLIGMDEFGLYERRRRKGMTFEDFHLKHPTQQLEEAVLAEVYEEPTDPESWARINAHLETRANNLRELIEELGIKRYGHPPKVGDVFCGGGSIPFEAARLGCDTYASDLNPMAALLTWSNQTLLCATPEDKTRIDAAQEWVYREVDRQITAWGIEHDDQGRRADAYLWCNEVVDPETGYRIPLAATWIISQKDKVVAVLAPDHLNKRYDIEIVTGASDSQMKAAKDGTVVKQHLIPPPTPDNPSPAPTHMSRLRDRHNNGQGLHKWSKDDISPRDDDFYQERLYCIRWLETDERGKARRRYEKVTEDDLARETRCLELLRERITDWQEAGFVPSGKIEDGSKTEEPTRSRGWTHWHHLFTPRQLLTNGLFAEAMSRSQAQRELLGLVGRNIDFNNKLCRWIYQRDLGAQGFDTQSISPLYNWNSRTYKSLEALNLTTDTLRSAPSTIELRDARTVTTERTLWITDPPYADAVAYEEISEFFLAWYEKQIPKLFPGWYADSKRALALKGTGQSFNEAMVEIYSNLTNLMPDNGVQIVMFTHKDPAIWADLGMAMWASGLRVSAAWTIATETTTGLKAETNSVQGTVLMVLRKRDQAETIYDDEALIMMDQEVDKQLQDMQALEYSGLQWTDADLLQSMYVAALRALTSYNIDGLDPKAELLKVRARGEKSRVQEMMEQAANAATSKLSAHGISAPLWKSLTGHERFYLKALEAESHGEKRNGTYQELARSLAAQDWNHMLASDKANQVRVMSPTEMGNRVIAGSSFQSSMLRHVLLAIQILSDGEAPIAGINWMKDNIKNYNMQEKQVLELLEYLSKVNLPSWSKDSESALTLRGAILSQTV